jgi:hypothetical protein
LDLSGSTLASARAASIAGRVFSEVVRFYADEEPLLESKAKIASSRSQQSLKCRERRVIDTC